MRFGVTEAGDGGRDQSWRDKLPLVDALKIITKSPELIEDLPDNALLECTITGLGGTRYEPGVAPVSVTGAAYRAWKAKIGKDRTIFRFDPIIPYYGIWEQQLSRVEEFLAEEGRVRISFFDAYKHSTSRMHAVDGGNSWQGLPFHAPLALRQEILAKIEEIHKGPVEICSEPNMRCDGCVSIRDAQAVGIEGFKDDRAGYQRPLCHCIGEKFELLNNRQPCPNGCLYCYWK